MSITVQQAVKQLWEAGELDFKLKGKQKDLKQDLLAGIERRKVYPILSSRRIGKSYILTCLAFSIAIKKPNQIIKYACPTKQQAEDILEQIIPDIIHDCPEHLKPNWVPSKDRWEFPNGSMIMIAAVNNKNEDKLRGGKCHLGIVDEAAFVDRLGYLIRNILIPTTATTGGKIIMASTPNWENPIHEYHTTYCKPLLDSNELKIYTIYDAPMVSEESLQEIIAEYPEGKDNPQFRCEYMCEFAVDTTKMVITTFTQEVQDDIIREWERPPFFDVYVAGDPAAEDLTVMLFAYVDYINQKIIIEDELVLGGGASALTTLEIADGIKRKENLLYPMKVPYKRIMDSNNKILFNDLFIDHNLRFHATDKRDKLIHIDKVNRAIASGNIIINPRCENLIYHMKTTKWKINSEGVKKTFLRVSDDPRSKFRGHHGDAVDALIYLVRNVDFNKNPYPDDYGVLSGENVHNSHNNSNSRLDRLAEAMGLKQRKRK